MADKFLLIIEPFSKEEFLNFIDELRSELSNLISELEDLIEVKTNG